MDSSFLLLPPLSDPATNQETVVQYLAGEIDHIMMPRIAGNPTRAHRFTFRLSDALDEFLWYRGFHILNALERETGLLIAFTGDRTLICASCPQRRDSS